MQNKYKILNIIIFVTINFLLLTCKPQVKSENPEEIAKSSSMPELLKEVQDRTDSAAKNVEINLDSVYINEKFENIKIENISMAILIKERHLKASAPLPVYNEDSRTDVYNLPPFDQDFYSSKIACLISSSLIIDLGNDSSLLKVSSYQKEYNLCSKEKFVDQYIAANCTAFAISPNIVVSAGHCINRSNLNNFRLVYGFIMKGVSQNMFTISNKDIFKFYAVKFHSNDMHSNNERIDYSILEIYGKVDSNRICNFRKNGKIKTSEYLTVGGYPNGLPLKIAYEGKIGDNENKYVFNTNLDTYHGNSGSPVFNSKNYIVEGILIRGDVDFETEQFLPGRFCQFSRRCLKNNCLGEDVFRITILAPYLKELINNNKSIRSWGRKK